MTDNESTCGLEDCIKAFIQMKKDRASVHGFICPKCGQTFTFEELLDARCEDEDWCAREFGGDEVSVNILTRCPRCGHIVSIVVNYAWDGRYDNTGIYLINVGDGDGEGGAQ